MRYPCIVALALLGSNLAAAEPLTKRYSHELTPDRGEEFTQLTIDNPLGDVRVVGTDSKTVTLVAVKRGGSKGALERLKVAVVPAEKGHLKVRARLDSGPEMRPLPAGSVRVDLVVQAPRDASIRASVWKGQLDVQDFHSDADLSSSQGDISVQGVVGRVVTDNLSGRQELRQLVGEVRARAFEGAIDMRRVRSPTVWASVNRGSVVAREVWAGELVVRVFDGDIDFELDAGAGGNFEFFAYRGDIRVRVTSRRGLRVVGRSREGQVHLSRHLSPSRDESGAVVGRMAGAGESARVSLSSRYGDVNFAVVESAL